MGVAGLLGYGDTGGLNDWAAGVEDRALDAADRGLGLDEGADKKKACGSQDDSHADLLVLVKIKNDSIARPTDRGDCSTDVRWCQAGRFRCGGFARGPVRMVAGINEPILGWWHKDGWMV